MPATPTLEPQVKGRLADTEAAIIKLIQEGVDTWRTSISVESTLALAAVRAAHSEKRDFSNFLAVALEEYSRRRGAPTPALAEFIGKLQAAATDQQETARLVAVLDAALRKSQRRNAA